MMLIAGCEPPPQSLSQVCSDSGPDVRAAQASQTCREDRVDRYFDRLSKAIPHGLEDIASACYDEAIVDLTDLPARAKKVRSLVLEMADYTKRAGMSLKLVGGTAVREVLQEFVETENIPCFDTVTEARSA